MDNNNQLDPLTQEYILRRAGSSGTPVEVPSEVSAAAGIPGLLARGIANLQDLGVIYRPQNRNLDRPLTDVLFVRDPKDSETMAHEIEHLLARRGLGSRPYAVEDKFDELYKTQGGLTPTLARNAFIKEAIKSTPYLEKTYGFSPDYYFEEKHLGSNAPMQLFSEQLASLAAFEQLKNVDLTKDPYLRETLFKDPMVRQAYNAMTGLRQTRLDPRDIPPYTVVQETPKTKQTNSVAMPDGYKAGGRVRMI